MKINGKNMQVRLPRIGIVSKQQNSSNRRRSITKLCGKWKLPSAFTMPPVLFIAWSLSKWSLSLWKPKYSCLTRCVDNLRNIYWINGEKTCTAIYVHISKICRIKTEQKFVKSWWRPLTSSRKTLLGRSTGSTEKT